MRGKLGMILNQLADKPVLVSGKTSEMTPLQDDIP